MNNIPIGIIYFYFFFKKSLIRAWLIRNFNEKLMMLRNKLGADRLNYSALLDYYKGTK